MSEPTPETLAGNASPRPVLNYDGGSELEQLHAEYVEAKAAAKAADDRAKAVTSRLKTVLTEAFPEDRAMALEGPGGPPLELVYGTKWLFDSKRFKADDPDTYVRYAYQSGTWTLQARRGQG